mmetsp:Transcript_14360/g.33534  ORF Transcript_14360/g.33534 Transcript_14360/m.33534 type:complete len:224 (-) Transcript_14360:46-717(-)
MRVSIVWHKTGSLNVIRRSLRPVALLRLAVEFSITSKVSEVNQTSLTACKNVRVLTEVHSPIRASGKKVQSWELELTISRAIFGLEAVQKRMVETTGLSQEPPERAAECLIRSNRSAGAVVFLVLCKFLAVFFDPFVKDGLPQSLLDLHLQREVKVRQEKLLVFVPESISQDSDSFVRRIFHFQHRTKLLLFLQDPPMQSTRSSTIDATSTVFSCLSRFHDLE